LSVTFTPTTRPLRIEHRQRLPRRAASDPTITWAPPSDIVYGTALGAAQLNATVACPAPSRTVRSLEQCCQRRDPDLVGHLHADRRDELRHATASVSLSVLKATPTVTWTSPVDIVYGTALSATH
jgi:hypothetical protein